MFVRRPAGLSARTDRDAVHAAQSRHNFQKAQRALLLSLDGFYSLHYPSTPYAAFKSSVLKTPRARGKRLVDSVNVNAKDMAGS
ncbi:hypothetical protein EYF80_026123 [Liparis tanakae]|uniref:Uncharacterized protein n=1 Tax=Liparis tanakae TaxID=230148 RepID=A0A4Z2HEJ0_9TELE|nr:hypothetical protein EYF80_026123 [Liparis tanakae]